MTGLAMRKELHSLIDTMPERSLPVIMPLLSFIAEEYWKPIIETDLTDEEHSLIEAGMQEYERNPSSFITLEEFQKRLKDGTALQI